MLFPWNCVEDSTLNLSIQIASSLNLYKEGFVGANSRGPSSSYYGLESSHSDSFKVAERGICWSWVALCI